METKWRKLFSKKSAGLWIFVGAALAVAVLLAVFVSPWASSSPDGLDKTAEEKGFVEKAEQQKPAWKHSPVPGYAMPGVKNEKAATGLSGLVGVLITLVVAVAVGLLALGLARFRNANKTTGDEEEQTLET